MDANQNDKKRLQVFMGDMLKIGSLHGFKYFNMYLRGREELVITIPNEPARTPSFMSPPLSPLGPVSEFSPSSSYGSGGLASRFSHLSDSCPPASPMEDNLKDDPNQTMFLLACYTRYSRPLVWARSNQDRLKLILGSNKIDQDNPLSLKTTTLWKDKDVKVWEVLVELVRVNTHPCPSNPFAIDWEYIESLMVQERVLITGALISFLQRVIQHQASDRAYSARVLEDLVKLSKKHFQDLHTLIHQGGLPILEKQQSKTQPANAASMNSPLSQRYTQGNKYRY